MELTDRQDVPIRSGVLIHIRKATERDLDAVESLYHASKAWLLGQNIHQWSEAEGYPTREYAVDNQAEGNLYLAQSNGDTVATYVLNECQPPMFSGVDWRFDGKVVVLHTLVVHPGCTGKGIGRQAVAYAIATARDQGYDTMRLDVFPGNAAAVRLYQSVGFRCAGKVFYAFKEPSYEWYDCYERQILQDEYNCGG